MVRAAMTLVFAAVWMNVWADEVTEKQALEEAHQFVSSHNNRKSTPTVKSAGQVSGLYLFNVSGNGGFVIVSNDDQTMPILGFGESGNIDPDDLPDNMRAWLQSYADQIAWLQSNGKDAKDTNNRSRAPRRTAKTANEPLVKTNIEPLVKTNWNQSIPYYNMCPTIDAEHVVTGCVATTLAQLMYYHKWPQTACTALPGYTTKTKNKNKKSINLTVSDLEATTFDWDNMIANYTPINPNTGNRYLYGTEEQQLAVAKLMLYCGTALHMQYGLSVNGGSSAYNEAIPYALKTFFGYDGGIQHCYRKNYSYAAWVDLIYSELVANRPVALGGQSTGGGHSFICDGYKYDDADYFHINWGWAGSSDGYFQLSVLQPWEQGIGGSSTLDGFSFGQDAVIGIRPPVDGNADYCLSLEGLQLGSNKTSEEFTRANETDAFNGISLYYIVYNYSYGSKAYDYAVQLVDGGGKVMHTLYEATNQPMEWNENNKDKFSDATLSGLSIPSTADDGTHLNDGTYYIKVMSRPHNETPVAWQECFDGDAYKLTATISGNDLTINVPIPANITPASVTFNITGDSYTGAVQTVTATVTGGSGDYSGDIVLRVNGSAVVGQIAHIPAGETVDLSFSYIPSYIGTNTLTLWTHRSEGLQITGSETVNISTLIINDNGSDNTDLIVKNDGRSGNVKLEGRTLYKDGKWNTLCLPFNVTLAGSELAGAEARTLSTASLNNGVLTLNFGNPVTELTAGTPYIIKWANGENITNPVFTNVTVSKEPNDFNSSNVHFKGRYSSKTYTTEEKSTLLLSGDNTLYYPQPDLTTSASPQYPSIGACRAYFEIGNVAGVRAFKLNFGDETTGISEELRVKSEEFATAVGWYTLDGRRLSGKPTVKGLYINNGRKVVIK